MNWLYIFVLGVVTGMFSILVWPMIGTELYWTPNAVTYILAAVTFGFMLTVVVRG